MEVLFGESPHKLIQPGSTRWLSYENSIRVILDHYESLLLTIENIYNEGGINSTDAGGLLLQLRSSSCLYYIFVFYLMYYKFLVGFPKYFNPHTFRSLRRLSL